MSNEPIDWEATMKQTLTASKAASRGSERVVAAISEMVEQQQRNAIEMRKSREVMGQVLAELQVIKTGQHHLSNLTKRKCDKHQSQIKKPTIQPCQIYVVLGVLLCVALIAVW